MSRRRPNQPSFDPTLSRGIMSIVLIVAAIVMILSFFDQAGPLGFILNKGILSFIFGSLRFTTPIILLIIAWFLIKDVEYDYRSTHGIGTILFFITMSGLFHLHFSPDQMWAQAVLGNGGGIIGMTAWPLKIYLGSIAGGVILIGLLIVSILLMFNTLIVHLLVINKTILSSFGSFGAIVTKTINAVFIKNNAENIPNPEEENYDEEDGEETETEDTNEEENIDEKINPLISKKTINIKNDNLDEENDDETTAKNEKNLEAWPHRTIIKKLPPFDLLSNKRSKPTSGDIKSNSEIIKNTLKEFGMDVDMGEARVGPTVTRYTLKPSKGVKLSRILALSNDLSLALAAHPIRIEAPIPGKSLVGIEIPNEKTAIISFRELLETPEYETREHNMMIALGKDVAGKTWFTDLPRMPHLLVAGSTGSGKTVCINTIIMSLLYQNTAETLRIIMVDPKRIELTLYNGIPHLLIPVITNTNKTINALKWTINEMERRFEILAQDKSQNLSSYNKKHPNDKIPYIVFIVDELADLMATSAGEIEASIIRLAQMARAVGIHLILATQRPSVDVITGLMKANIPGRIAFSLPSIIDSRTILDCPGAEKLLGRGDMLFLNSELSKPVRIQGAFISEEELKTVVTYLHGDEPPEYDDSIVEKQDNNGTINMFGGASDDQDPMFMEARRAILEMGKASASLLQRRLKIGYSRAARILDQMEAAGIIGPGQGSKPREILTTESNEMTDNEIEMSEKMHGKKSINMELNKTEEYNDAINEEDELEKESNTNYDIPPDKKIFNNNQ